MNETMNRTFGEQSGNAKKHLDTVENLCRDILHNHEIFSNDLKSLSNEMLVLREKVKKNPHELRKFFVEKLTPVRDTLTFSEEEQRQENKEIQEIMTEIKRQNRETGEAIVKTFQKLKYLDRKVGQYN